MTPHAKAPRRVVVVDDERPARDELRYLMQGWDDVEVVGEAASVEDAKDVIAAAQPDLVLLDIQLRKRSGFELLSSGDVDYHVIFVTAYADYAVRAFEVSAVDYLLKPVEPERLREALNRVGELRPPLVSGGRLDPQQVVIVRTGRRYHFLPVSEIRYIEAHGEYCEVHGLGVSGYSNRPLADWGDALPPDRFVRIHRARIANLHFVSMMVPTEGTSFELVLRDSDERLPVSRRYAARLRALLS